MTASNISSALTSNFKKSGYHGKVTCTKIRKRTVTEVHDLYSTKGSNKVAGHMCHRFATAEKSYKLMDKEKNAKHCTRLIRSVNLQNSSISITDKQGEDQVEQCATSSQEIPVVPRNTSPPLHEQHISQPRIGQAHILSPYKKKLKWTIENRDIIRTKFHNFIFEQECRIEDDVRTILNEDPEFVDKLKLDLDLTGKCLVGAVRDKIRSFYRGKYKNIRKNKSRH